MRQLRLLLPLLILSFTCYAQALFVEVGLSYNYMKRTFSELDKVENQSTTGSMAFYAWEQIAIELSYTNGLYVKKEKETSLTSSTAQRTTTQYSDIYEANLIYVFADKKATFQPYIKGGAAYIKKKQVVQIDNDVPFQMEPKPGFAPSYGFGMKFLLSESFAIKASYDAVRTPIDDSTAVDDITGRVGVSWIF
ncbi:MAG: outer membrane protein [Bdellovibrio sp.]|jgi:opacity protein-like surface antigen